jgi:hypothetical protein
MGTSASLQPEPAQRQQPAANTPPPERNWRAAIAGQQPAFAWLVAALLGMAVIHAAPPNPVVRLILPIAVMILYAWFTYPRDSSAGPGLLASRIAQLADSAYFLGFLWTLWALIDSFVLKRAAPDDAFLVFGYALVTTFAGMGTRLYLLQFKYGAGDQAAQAELTVERNLQLLSAAMHDSLESIRAFHGHMDTLNRDVDGLSRTLVTLDRQFVETHRRTTEAIRDNITTVVDEIRGALKAPVQEYGRSIRAFTANVDQQSKLLSETLQKSSGDVIQTVRDASEKAHKVIQETGERIASDHAGLAGRLETQVTEIVDELGRLSDRLKTIDLPLDALKTLAGCFSEVERALGGLSMILGPQGEMRINLFAFAHEIQIRTNDVGNALAVVADRLRSIKVPPEVEIGVATVTQSIQGLDRAVGELLQKAGDPRWERASQTASDAALKLTASVNNLRHSIEEADATAKNVLTNVIKRKWWHIWRR